MLTKRELFDGIEDFWDQYEHGIMDWEALVERILGISEKYRKAHPITHPGRELNDKLGNWKDGL